MDASPHLIVVLNPADNVGVLRVPHGAVPRGHKIALAPIGAGDVVRKYGQAIGIATRDIADGEHVHSHNLAMTEAALAHEFCVDARPLPALSAGAEATFMGFRRADGRAGTRNFIAVISTVNCSATVARAIARHFDRDRLTAFPTVDGVIALTHSGGCGINTDGYGYRLLTRTLAGYAASPNVGGVLMIGLGCETNQIGLILERERLATHDRLRTMTIQEDGGTRAAIAHGIALVEAMLPLVGSARREPISAAELVLALECGGSDGYSGMSANPALGVAADLLVRHGGTAVLSETPEIYGAEHLLTRRATRPDVAERLLGRIDWWRDYAARNDAELNNNPSHGNKAGGLTTILEKSLGAVAKSGTAPLEAVYEYAERVTARGLVFMDTPGYDPAAVTGQIAGGCNLVCFTTGRGATAGYKPVPCLKLSSNTPMFERMEGDMDLDCGPVIDGAETIEQCGQRIFAQMLAVASGTPTASETLDYGDNEFVPWQVGAHM